MSERPYKKWLTILKGLEAEFQKHFPPNPEHKAQVHGKVPADVGKKLGREIRSIRAILRNLQKMEKR